MLRALLALSLIVALPLWAAEPRELTWSEMLPADTAPAAPPAAMHDLSKLADALAAETGPAASQQSVAAPVVKALDGQLVKLPGYIVPLDVTEEGRVTEFLLVPYYGACIHVPPPPPNQIIHVTLATPIALGDLWDPYRLAGRLQVKRFDADIASASYDAAAATLTAIHN